MEEILTEIMIYSLYVGILLAIFFVYMLPYVVSVRRKHRNKTAIGALNFLLGWTFLGWVASFVWAYTDYTEKKNDNS